MRKIAAGSLMVLVMTGVGILRIRTLGAAQRPPLAPGSYTDYVDDAIGTVTRAFSGGPLSYNLLQAGPNGMGRDLVAQLTPIGQFEPSDDDDEISLSTGEDIVISGPFILPKPNSYTISFRFHVPADALPERFKALTTQRVAGVRGPFERFLDFFVPPLQAADGDGISGIISDTFVPDTANGGSPRPVDMTYERYKAWYDHEVQRGALAEANMEELERKLVGQTITTGQECTDPEIAKARDYVRRARELAEDEMRFGKLTPAQQAARSGDAQQLAARRAAIDAELRGGRSFAGSSGSSSAGGAGSASRTSGAAASRAGTAVKVAGDAAAAAALALKLAQIQSDSERWQQRLKDLEDCARNPTNPLTRRAIEQDPNYKRATLDPIAGAEVEEAFVTNARRVAATTNAGASTAFNVVGAIGVGLIGEAEDSLLTRSMEQTLEQLETCVAKCRKRSIKVDFVYNYAGGTPANQHTTKITGAATLVLVPNGTGYEGEGQAAFRGTLHSANGCHVEDETTVGKLRLEGKAYFSTNNTRTGGLSVGRRDRTVLEIKTSEGDLLGTGTVTDCGTTEATRTPYNDYYFDCHFYDVDLKAGGFYERDKDRDADQGRYSHGGAAALTDYTLVNSLRRMFGPPVQDRGDGLIASRILVGAASTLEAFAKSGVKPNTRRPYSVFHRNISRTRK